MDPSHMPTTAIVVPCYNEAGRLVPADFLAAASKFPWLRFIFVNDGSRDDTGSILESMRAEIPSRVHVVTLSRNSGKAEAVRRGFLRAFGDGYELVGFWDADLAAPLAALPAFCRRFEDPGILAVIGSRVRLLGRKIERRPVRHYGGRVFATAVSLLLDLPVYDTQCGAKLFRNASAVRRVFGPPFAARWTFDVEILARLLLLERQSECPPVREAIVEYPLPAWRDVAGSRLKVTHLFGVFLDVARIAWLLLGPASGRSRVVRAMTDAA